MLVRLSQSDSQSQILIQKFNLQYEDLVGSFCSAIQRNYLLCNAKMSFRGRGSQSFVSPGTRSPYSYDKGKNGMETNGANQDYSRMAPPSSLSGSSVKTQAPITPGLGKNNSYKCFERT